MSKINITKDLLVGLNNGYFSKNKFAYCKVNSFILEVLWVLYNEHLIEDFCVDYDNSKVKIKLKYYKDKPLLNHLSLISKPSLISFCNYEELKPFYNKYDFFFLSTSYGILSSKSIKEKLNKGGLILFGLKLNI